MPTNRWEALMAEVAIDIQKFVQGVDSFGAAAAGMESEWNALMHGMEVRAQAVEESLGKLEHQLGLSGKEAAEFDKLFRGYQEAEQAEIEATAAATEKLAAEHQAWIDKVVEGSKKMDWENQVRLRKAAAEAEEHAAKAAEDRAAAEAKAAKEAEKAAKEAEKAAAAVAKYRDKVTARASRGESDHIEQIARSQKEAAAAAEKHNREIDRQIALIQENESAERRFLMVLDQAVEMEQTATAWHDQQAMALDRLQEEAEQAEAAIRQTANATKGNSMFVLEFGRAIEDAAIGWSFNGIRGAVLGASNNIARMAEMGGQVSKAFSTIAPYAAVFVSIGAAAYTVWQNFAEAEEAIDEANKRLDEHIDRLREVIELRQDEAVFHREVADMGYEDAQSELARIQEEIARQEDARTEAIAEQEHLHRLIQNHIEAIAAIQSAATDDNEGVFYVDSEALAELEHHRNALASLQRSIAATEVIESGAREELLRLAEQQEEVEGRIEVTLLKHQAIKDNELEQEREALRLVHERAQAEEHILEQRRIMAEISRLEDEEAQARLDRLAAEREMQGVLDPDRAALNTVMAQGEQRRQQIEADQSLGPQMRQSLLDDNARVMREQFEDIFNFDRLQESSDALGQMLMEGELTADQFAELQSILVTLEERFDAGTITVENFNNAIDLVEDEMQNLAQAAEEAAEAERRAALLRGDWEAAGLDPQQAIEDRLIQERMRQWNQMIDQQVDMILGVNTGYDQMAKEMKRFEDQARTAGDALSTFQGNPAEAFDNLWSYLNSVDGQIQNTENTLALMEQTLARFGDSMDVFRKQELERAIDDLTSILQKLYDSQRGPFITGISEPIFEDPGLQGGAGRGRREGRTTGPSGPILMSFPNIERLTNEAVGSVADRLMAENARRGIRTL